jgi:hypothetical protein
VQRHAQPRTYGLKPSVTITFKDGRTQQVAIDQLADYVTKLTPEAEETAASIKDATVQYPIPYCQNNVEIIDTPGLNDDTNMTAVTLGVLPQVDAAILVIMAQAPFSEYERDFLENKLLTNDLGRVIFVVTAIDRLNRPEDADRVVTSIRNRIQKHVMDRAAEQFGKDSEEYEVYVRKIGTPKVFGPVGLPGAAGQGDPQYRSADRVTLWRVRGRLGKVFVRRSRRRVSAGACEPDAGHGRRGSIGARHPRGRAQDEGRRVRPGPRQGGQRDRGGAQKAGSGRCQD